MKLAVIFDNFGPYHLARLQAASKRCSLLGIEIAGKSHDYRWKRVDTRIGWHRLTLFEDISSESIKHVELVLRLRRVLSDINADAIAIPGWSGRAAFVALDWCIANNKPVVVMSESTADDERRIPWREAIKRRYVAMCSAAIAGGSRHADYLALLGMRPERIFMGYDAVDNDYFAISAGRVRNAPARIPRASCLTDRYFLASARFIEKKNLFRLLEAYAIYRERCHDPRAGHNLRVAWSLVLLGDGPLRDQLLTRLMRLNLSEHVLLPGFIQYDALPEYYAMAGAFIHASTTEQWGLVVNEAMASGLVVLISNRCGCAPDLVREGVNGFTFDPCDVQALARLMFQVANLEPNRLATMGEASRRISSDWGLDRFASGLVAATECALRIGPKQAAFLDRLLLRALIAR